MNSRRRAVSRAPLGCPSRRPAPPRRQPGFTLMEVLLVLVILVILGTLAGVGIRSAQKTALERAARSQISLFERALDNYQLEMRNYPTTSQGLQSLVEPPSDLSNPARWNGPYLDVALEGGQRMIPADPWDNPYQYEMLDSDSYRIWSWGPDGIDGTEDDISVTR